MEEQARTLDLRPLLVVAAVVAGVLTLWASGAFASGGSSSEGGTPSQFVQDDGQSPDKRDCPRDRERGTPQGDSEGSGDPSL